MDKQDYIFHDKNINMIKLNFLHKKRIGLIE